MNELSQFDLGLRALPARAAKRLLGLNRVEMMYSNLRECSDENDGAAAFCRKSLAALGVAFELPQEELAALHGIEGPVVFVANHPFGAIDALVMMMLMGEVRADFKFMGNSILSALPELGPTLLPVRIMGDEGRSTENISAMRKVLRYLNSGGMMGLFPAGEVAAYGSWRSGEVAELQWHRHLGRLVQKSQATVVPLFFEGQNSMLFQYLGLALPRLRIALLVREMLKYRTPIQFKVGAPIPFSEVRTITDARSLSLHFRRRTFDLKTRA